MSLNYQSDREEETVGMATNKPKDLRKDGNSGGGGRLNFKNTRVVNMIFATILLGLGLLFLIVGIIYCTVYYYPYSFTTFSTILCAGLFIAFGSVVIIIAGINILLVRMEKNQLVLLTTFVAIILFVILLIVGIWGLVATTSNNMSYEVRNNMQYTIMNYDQTNSYNLATAKINWMQQTFNCCGIVNYMDWKNQLFNSYGPYGLQQQMQNQQSYYLNQIQPQPNVPYVSQVPDSCCVRSYSNCGKNFNVYADTLTNLYGQNLYLSGTANGQGVFQGGTGNYPVQGSGVGNWGYNQNKVQNTNIYTQGCLPIYVERYYKELMFIAIYCVIVAGISVLICVGYVILYFMTLKNAF